MTDALELQLPPRQHERLRSLARALVSDEQRAEDLVQDAWLRALERGPREPMALGAWLAAVVRRLASNGRRARRRRGERERAAARDEALPSSAEIATQVESEMGLYSALEGLPEPHRTILRDRYLGGLTPAQLAARDGLSLEAVKSRLRRARASLREALERDGLHDDSTWQHALMPLVFTPAPGSLGLSMPVLAGGTLAMKKLAALTALLVVAGGLVAWQVALRRPSPPAPLGALTPAEAAAAPSKARAVETPTAEPAPAGEAAPSRVALQSAGPTSGWILAGHVRRAGGGDVAGLAMTLTMHRGAELAGEVIASFEVESDSAGRFELALDPPDETVCFDIEVPPDPTRHIVVHSPYIAVRGEGPPEPLDVLVFERDARVAGVVLGPDGRPVPGADVEWRHDKAMTDADGHFSLAVTANRRVRLLASAAGLGQVECVVDILERGGLARVEIALPPGAIVRGVVTDLDGRPLRGARVELRGDTTRKTTTDADGRYELDRVALRTGARVQVSAFAEGHLAVSRPLVLDGERAEYALNFELAPGVGAQGCVRDPEGLPVAGAEIWFGSNPYAPDVVKTRTDDEGRFAVVGARPGRSKWGAKKAGFADGTLEADIQAGVELSLTLERPRTLRGTARDEGGEPIQGLGIAATRAGEYVGGTALTDDDGAFELTGLPPRGRLRLEAYGAGWVRTKLELEEGQGEHVVITLARSGVLAGRVVDAATGEPIETFTVRLCWPSVPVEGEHVSGFESSWVDPGRSFDDSEGRWSTGEHDALKPGAWAAVEVSAPAYATRRCEAVQVSPSDEVLELIHELVPPMRVEISVREEPGDAPIVGARVEAIPPQTPGGTDPVASAETGAAGLALLEGLGPGPLEIHLYRAGRVELRYGPYELAEGRAQTTIELRVPAGQPLEVLLRDAEGEARTGARVMLVASAVPHSEGARIFASTDAEGLARFEGVAPGRWLVGRAVGSGEWPTQDLRKRVEVAADAPPERVLLEPTGNTTLLVRVEGELTPPEGTLVRLSAPDAVPRAATTHGGVARIAGLGPGQYTVEVSFWHPGTGTSAQANGQIGVRAGDDDVEVALEATPRSPGRPR